MKYNEINKAQASETKSNENRDTIKKRYDFESQPINGNKNSIKKEIKDGLSSVLDLSINQILDDIPFHEYGLDSVGGVELMNLLNRRFNIKIQTPDLYEHYTVDKLLKHIETVILKDQGSDPEKQKITPIDISATDGMSDKRLDDNEKNNAKKISDNIGYLDKESEKLNIKERSAVVKSQGAVQKRKRITLNKISAADGMNNELLDNSTKNKDDMIRGKSGYVNNKSEETNNKDVAVIGMAGRFPGADDIDTFWKNLCDGVDSIKEIPNERLGHMASQSTESVYCKKGGFINDIDKFDPLYFRISPAEAELMDPQQRIFLETSIEALEDSGYTDKYLNNTSCGVSVGIVSNEYALLTAHKQYDDNDTLAYRVLGGGHSFLPSRVSYFLNLKGPSIAVDTACSSSLVAVDNAYQALVSGRADMMLAGGVSLTVTEERFLITSSLEVLSREGQCRTFDNTADGYVPGEGVGVVVMKRLSDAVRDNDHIYGVIKGSSTNHDGRTNGITAPNAESQKALELEVYKTSGINPGTITYVEAHGTGTKLGDPIEVRALTEAFRQYTNKKQYCAIGSVKTNVGHAAAAAGIFGLIKVLLSIKNRKIPPSLHYKTKNEYIDFENSPFYVNTELRDWKEDETKSRRVATSSFGLSGTNCHMIIEEYPVASKNNRDASFPCYIIPFSAKTETALMRKLDDFALWLNNNEKDTIGDISFTLLAGRNHFSIRSVFIVKDIDDLKMQMKKVQENGISNNYNTEKYSEPPMKQDVLMKELGKYILSEIENRPLDALEYIEKIEALTQLYLKGYDFDWKSLFKNKAGTISLPTYPFEKDRYWVEKKEIPVNLFEDDSKKDLKSIHKFISIINYDKNNKRVTVKFTGEEFYLRGHVIAGNKVVPAVLYSEIIRVASEELIGDHKIKTLENYIFAAPLVVGEKGKEITIDFHDILGGYNVEIYCFGDNHQKVPVLTVDILYGNLGQQDKEPEFFDINKVMKRAEQTVNGENIYEGCKTIQLYYAPFFQSVQKVIFSGKEALGVLKLSDDLNNTLDAFEFHPIFMDGSLQASACLMVKSIASMETKFYTPYMLGKIELLGKFSKKCYVYATPAGKTPDKNSDILQFNISLINDSGQIVLRMKNMILKNIDMALFEEDTQKLGSLLDMKKNSFINKLDANIKDNSKKSIINDAISNKIREELIILASNILKLGKEKINVNVDLREYGFESINVAKFTNYINNKFNIDMSPADIFNFRKPTLSLLADYMRMEYEDVFNNLYQDVINNNDKKMNNDSIPFNTYLKPTDYFDCDNLSLLAKVKELTAGIPKNDNNKKAIKLFDFARDEIRFFFDEQESMSKDSYKASNILRKGSGWCIQKSILFASLCRTAGIPSRLHHLDIKNYKAVPITILGKKPTNLFAFHGYVEIYLDEKWVKVDPAFDDETCKEMGYPLVEFDGKNNALLASVDSNGKKFVKYTRDYGVFEDFSFEKMIEVFIKRYDLEHLKFIVENMD